MGKGSGSSAGNVSGIVLKINGFVLGSLSALGGHLKIINPVFLVSRNRSENTLVNTLIGAQRVSLKINNFTAPDKEWGIDYNKLGTLNFKTNHLLVAWNVNKYCTEM